jgi:hypothetical protein
VVALLYLWINLRLEPHAGDTLDSLVYSMPGSGQPGRRRDSQNSFTRLKVNLDRTGKKGTKL